jgi:roadblock/LC7 domain-containing protein
MKFKNISAVSSTLEISDCGTYVKGITPQQRFVNLKQGDSVYLPDGSDVMYSAQAGDAHRYAAAGVVAVNDTVQLANAAAYTIAHNFNFLPKVTVAYNNGGVWEDCGFETGKVTVKTNAAMTQTVITNVSGGALTLHIRIS